MVEEGGHSGVDVRNPFARCIRMACMVVADAEAREVASLFLWVGDAPPCWRRNRQLQQNPRVWNAAEDLVKPEVDFREIVFIWRVPPFAHAEIARRDFQTEHRHSRNVAAFFERLEDIVRR